MIPLDGLFAVLSLPALIVSSDFVPGGGPLNGRRLAGQQLLRLWAGIAQAQPITLLMAQIADAPLFTKLLQEAGHTGPLQVLPLHSPLPRAAVGGMFVADASIGRWAQWRRPASQAAFSLIGQIHTICTPAAIAQITDLATESLAPWDALICSSTAGKAVVEALITDREHQLIDRTGGSMARLIAQRPQLPVIPLPIPAAQIAAAMPSRAEARAALAIPNSAHVLLWLGRLSMLTKQDPWPTYQMLQAVATRLDQPLILLECGQNDTPAQAQHFQELRNICPAVQFLRLGGSEPIAEKIKYQAMAAADIGLFLVDNLQETFGLAVAEAMAAGLPLVASDWDGFRDLVRHGIDGFLVPTRFASSAFALSTPLAWQQLIGLRSYPEVAGAFAQLVQIDMCNAFSALLTLLLNPELRRAMAKRAAERALNNFDQVVVKQKYIELFSSLAELRKSASSQCHQPQNPPAAQDLARAFASFPSDSAQQPPPLIQATPLDKLPNQVQAGRAGLWQLLLDLLPASDQQQLLSELAAKHSPMHSFK